MDKIDDTTFISIPKDDPKDKIEVEIGDSKQPDFRPQAKIMRWNNEVNFSLRAEEKEGAVVEEKDGKIKYITPEYEVHQYEKPQIGEDGGFEFEWVLKEKPSSNVLTATIQTKGLDFFYQPPLTQQEVDQGAERPDNVVGSYAVYNKRKEMNTVGGMEYKTNKAFHIYRPKVIDANGVEAWGQLYIDEELGQLSVTIDQTWLDNAVYPVTVDPTFGFTSIGGTNNTSNSTNWMWCFIAISGGDAAGVGVESITMYNNAATGTQTYKYVLTSSSGNILTDGVAPEVTGVDTTAAWRTATYISPPVIAASTTYWISFLASGSSASRYYYDSVANTLRLDLSNSYTTPVNTGATSAQSIKLSIYATYTVAPLGSLSSVLQESKNNLRPRPFAPGRAR